MRLTTPLLSVVVRDTGRGDGELLVGAVVPDVLERAVTELANRRRP